MKQKISKKILIVMSVILFITILFSIKVYAADTSFSFDKESVDVKLNQKKYIGMSGDITYSSSDDTIKNSIEVMMLEEVPGVIGVEKVEEEF